MSAICTRVVLLNVAMDKKIMWQTQAISEARKGKVALGLGTKVVREKGAIR